MLLQNKPLWKAAELADELKVSERTIHRYMGMLEEMGIPIYTERGPYGGFALMRGYKLPPLIFTAEEATVLYMGARLVEKMWGQVYQDAVTGVTAKLDNVLPDDLRRQVAQTEQSLVVGGLAARDYRPWAPTLQVLRECIRTRHALRITYRSFKLEETCREVEPYAMVFRWGLWYVVGLCRLRGELRTFRVDRIADVAALDEQFRVPDDFSAQTYVDETMRFDNRYTIEVHMDARIAPHVRERSGHWLDLENHEDGSVTIRMKVSDLAWATGWVLSYGDAATALAPPELVERVRAEAEAIMARYGEKQFAG
jgi:predicted DNA-binding transcriptional regulator YafY